MSERFFGSTQDITGIHGDTKYIARQRIWKNISESLFKGYVEKNTDYGDSFIDGIRDIGPVSFVTRVYDKVKRMITLSKQPAKVKSESFDDSVRDVVTYGMMYLMLQQEEAYDEPSDN